jgi:hypothetical protein
VVVTAIATPARAIDPEDIFAGPSVTIDAPATYTSGTPFAVRGSFLATVGLHYVEAAGPIPDQRIDIVWNGAVVASATTGADGSYSASVTFDGQAPFVRTIRAVAFRGEAIETSSRDATMNVDDLIIELTLSPSSATVPIDGTLPLIATGTTDRGREVNVTERATWASSNDGVATVSNSPGDRGTVTGLRSGTTTITATIDGVSATANISVP